MQPSSLVFLVIIGMWAVFLAQYWVRRRDHIATARSVDALSETMRVLQRRETSTGPSSHAGRSYAASSSRAGRTGSAIRASVGRAGRSATSAAGAAVGAAAAAAGSAGAATVETATREDTVATVATVDTVGAGLRGTAEQRAIAMRPPRVVRGLTLLTGLAGTLVVSVLTALGVLLSWAPLIPLTVALAGFFWLRSGVQGEITARRAARDATRAGTVSAGSVPVAGEPEVVAREAVPTSSAVAVEPSRGEDAPSVAADGVEGPSAVQPDPDPDRLAPLEVDEDDIPLTWDPVPVPRPTYTMKARVEHRLIARPAEDPACGDPAYGDLEYGDVPAGGEDDAAAPRRVAGA